MKRQQQSAFTLIEVLIVIAIVAILIAALTPNLLRGRVTAYEGLAESTLHTMAAATEAYSNLENGSYPTDMTSLTGATPPYLNKNYCNVTHAGFIYTCTFINGGYTFTASPLTMGVTGTTTYTVTTGGIHTP